MMKDCNTCYYGSWRLSRCYNELGCFEGNPAWRPKLNKEAMLAMIREQIMPLLGLCQNVTINVDSSDPEVEALFNECLVEFGIEATTDDPSEDPAEEANFLEVKDLYRAYGHNYIQLAEPVIPPVGRSRSTLASVCAPTEVYDEVGKPSHYNKDRKVEHWDWQELGLSDEEFRGAMKYNIWKYTSRYPEKNGLQDLEKAQAYLDRLKQFESGIRMKVMKSGPGQWK